VSEKPLESTTKTRPRLNTGLNPVRVMKWRLPVTAVSRPDYLRWCRGDPATLRRTPPGAPHTRALARLSSLLDGGHLRSTAPACSTVTENCSGSARTFGNGWGRFRRPAIYTLARGFRRLNPFHVDAVTRWMVRREHKVGLPVTDKCGIYVGVLPVTAGTGHRVGRSPSRDVHCLLAAGAWDPVPLF
jgi:hypothetical protein